MKRKTFVQWVSLFLGGMIGLFTSCDSGDIYPSDRTATNDNIAVSGTFVLSGVEKIPSGYQLIFGAFDANSKSPIVWTNVVEPKEDEPVNVSLSSVPPEATIVKLALFTMGRKAIYDFYTYDISAATENIDLPSEKVSLLLKYGKIQEIFEGNCTACHGTDRGGAGLFLGEGVSYRYLVNHPATNSTKLRVEPYSISNSFLMDVLTNEQVTLNQPHSSILYQDDINLLKAWIETGAENN
jgi:hypothetical protein